MTLILIAVIFKFLNLQNQCDLKDRFLNKVLKTICSLEQKTVETCVSKDETSLSLRKNLLEHEFKMEEPSAERKNEWDDMNETQKIM